MATVDFPVQNIGVAGIDMTDNAGLVATTNNYTFSNDGNVFMHIKKSGAGSCTVTITTPNTVDGFAIADATVVVPASTGDMMIGPFRPETFNDANGKVS